MYKMLSQNELDANNLMNAVRATFHNRETTFKANHPIFSDDFATNQNRNMYWQRFLKKIKNPENLEFSVVIKSIVEKLYPIYLELINNT